MFPAPIKTTLKSSDPPTWDVLPEGNKYVQWIEEIGAYLSMAISLEGSIDGRRLDVELLRRWDPRISKIIDDI